MTGAAGALAEARRVSVAVYVIELDGMGLRLAMSPDEVGPLLGRSADTVRRLCHEGRIRARNLAPGSRNGRYLISVGALVEFLGGSDDPVPPVD